MFSRNTVTRRSRWEGTLAATSCLCMASSSAAKASVRACAVHICHESADTHDKLLECHMGCSSQHLIGSDKRTSMINVRQYISAFKEVCYMSRLKLELSMKHRLSTLGPA